MNVQSLVNAYAILLIALIKVCFNVFFFKIENSNQAIIERKPGKFCHVPCVPLRMFKLDKPPSYQARRETVLTIRNNPNGTYDLNQSACINSISAQNGCGKSFS